MQWITVATPPYGSVEQFDEVMAHLGGEPEGLEARYVGNAEDGTLRIISFWESKAHADQLVARIGPVLAKVLGPEPFGAPVSVGIDVARTYTRQPVA